jgi:TolB protein
VSRKGGDSDIWLMDATGKNAVNLTKAEGEDTSPAWSADGKKLAFVSARDGGSDIYVMDVK